VNSPNGPDRTFATFGEILEFAIRREIEAAEGYAGMAGRCRPGALRDLLLDLRTQEQGHEKLLRDFAAGRLAPFAGRDVPDLAISDYTVDEPLGPESSLQALLLFAAKKEAKAAALYGALGAKVADPEHKRLFDFLVQEERSHKLRLEQEIEGHVLEDN